MISVVKYRVPRIRPNNQEEPHGTAVFHLLDFHCISYPDVRLAGLWWR